MISFEYIDRQILARLDAEGTDAYELNLDRIAAVNGAQDLLQSVMTSLFEAKKFSAEALRDLHYNAVYQTNHYGQVTLDLNLNAQTYQAPERFKLWTVVAVHPEFVPQFRDAAPDNDPVRERSKMRPDIRFIAPIKSADRGTFEDWSKRENDVFAPGNSLLTGSLVQYVYFFGSRPMLSSSTNLSQLPLTIRPHVSGTRRLVAIDMLKAPRKVPEMQQGDSTYTTFELEWPESMTELVISLALRFIAFKQGDQTNLAQLTGQEMSMLLSANG